MSEIGPFVTAAEGDALWAAIGSDSSGFLGDAVLLGGQSNQSGRGVGTLTGNPGVQMLGNDYLFKQAYEPVDDNTGQVDTISSDPQANKHSKNLKMGIDVNAATGRTVLLIPCALGSTTTAQWALATPNPYNRATLHGSMLYRATVAENAGYIPRWLDWIQGEQDASDGVTPATFAANTAGIWDAVRALYPGLPVLYAQLGPCNGLDSAQYWPIREMQRLMAHGSGSQYSVRNAWMAVMHDLPILDPVHLNTTGQLELGRRFALLARQRICGQQVDGTGPRVVSVNRAGAVVTVKTTQVINSSATYDGYFTVQDGTTMHTLTSGGIASVARDPADDTAVLITLATAPAGGVTVHYQPPEGRAANVWMVNVVRGLTVPAGLTYGLPLPAFSVSV